MRRRLLSALVLAGAAVLACKKDGPTGSPQPGVGAIELDLGDVRYLTAAEKTTFTVGRGEYTLVVFNGSPTGASNLQIEAAGENTAAAAGPPNPAILSSEPLAVSPAAAGRPVEYDRRFERELRQRERRALQEFAPAARAWRQRRPSTARFDRIAAPPQVGDRITLNTSSRSCTDPSDRVGFVRAISERAIIVADSANPDGGYTDEDYRAFAIAFDTLVYPVNVDNFGVPEDIDENGRSLIFFTRAVNELTAEGDSSVVGGFFFGRDLLPRSAVGDFPGCAGSNEAELFYMLVPDPAGVVNNNKRSKDQVARRTVGVLAHEFQHLINASRRLFINAALPEVVWLNEGLSHIAEELVFYRASGLAPLQNIDLQRLRSSQRILDAVNAYQVENLGRFVDYLEDPERNSPYQLDDDFATRGSAWALLRYAADQKSLAQQPIWFALVNNVETGLPNFTKVFGEGVPRVRDWTVSVYTDDAASNVPQTFRQASWNYRSVYPAIATGYPLKTRQLVGSTPVPVTLSGGGGVFFRFSVAANTATVRLTSQSASVPVTVEAALARTK